MSDRWIETPLLQHWGKWVALSQGSEMAQIPGAVTFPLLLPLLIISGTFLNATTVNEDANERLSQFWRSVERISEKTADKLTAVGNVVEEIAFELERGHSMCYQIGESILRNGFHEKWSAQSKGTHQIQTGSMTDEPFPFQCSARIDSHRKVFSPV